MPRSIAPPHPDVVRALTRDGVPRAWFYAGYAAVRELQVVDVPPIGRLIRFATSGLGASLLVEPVLGEVLFRVNVRGATPAFVNTSLAQFTATARAVVDRYPYYSLRSSPLDIDAAAAEVAAIVDAIDAPALAAGAVLVDVRRRPPRRRLPQRGAGARVNGATAPTSR